ncbi:hypothetical protein BOTBODRAFT_298029 [Botryobasidium botryosum FD-172 SS1]|uniref:NmrA-like domain-containing protein n=1 Tax=Botryobasidium botryosum (strain FD-172 SS1) TaxID=930990 RepID=A0A067MII3_BOTB1|nr:hypothetical protein BOTBODRAFT_298029 [Botryobasidium botryosum FD-172 SS1]
MAPLILVTAATGVQGGSTARQLLAQHVPVRAFVRDPSEPSAQALQKLGAEIVKGDFDDVAAITAAVTGVSGVFLNTFPSFTDPGAEIRCAQTFVDAAKAAGSVKSFVVSTVFKAGEKRDALAAQQTKYPFLFAYYSSKAGVEDVVRRGGFENTTVLRPGWLNYNYLSPPSRLHFPEYESEHVLSVSYSRDFKLNHFDPEDVGKFAAGAFVQPERFQGTIELEWEALTFDEIAAVISKVSGVEVSARFRTAEETKAILEAGTLPVVTSQVWMQEANFEGESLEKYGFELGTLEGFLTREKKRLLETLGV